MKILRTFAVSPATAISFLILPFVLGIYYFVTIYTDRFVNESGFTFFDVQSTIFTSIFLEQKWVGWFNRFMDFALWGALAAAVLVAGWMISAARVAIQNHYTEQGFVHFKVPKNTWHSHFIVVAIVKIFLVLGAIYCIIAFLGQAIPLLVTNIGNLLQTFSWSGVWPLLYTVLLMVVLQYLFVTCIKLFKMVRADAD